MGPCSSAGAQLERERTERRHPSEILEQNKRCGRKKAKIGILYQDSPDEEDWEVQSYEIEVAILCIELSRFHAPVGYVRSRDTLADDPQ